MVCIYYVNDIDIYYLQLNLFTLFDILYPSFIQNELICSLKLMDQSRTSNSYLSDN